MKQYCYSCLFLLLAIIAGVSPAQAQTKQPQAKPHHARLLAANVSRVNPAALAAAAPPPPVAAPVVLAGRVETLAGALPGAVVRLSRLDQVCVTDAQGNFSFTVPAGMGPEAAVASYAGFADVAAALQPGTTLAVVQLLTPVNISLPKQQQLKAYLKTARQEVRYDLRQIK
ncbi:carboxypeptidase-like regulatory domain-containing protein [Hymenobacter sp. PAMC 26628]|uniref:carboxypeptidase-like regulatory domain-containing protein n=1 Tax=Hymenobacter sp. PAMC 26628 TaxID=1484118 RepID=UPI0007700FAF|nr:carboxypeptidase-like regulatory domain-containing protein [Hymenobacter sp. PAMC 26628]AMJ64559.1 hypothetical protein AXW84_03310 [Hymenobacter sp. PAMC 26628]